MSNKPAQTRKSKYNTVRIAVRSGGGFGFINRNCRNGGRMIVSYALPSSDANRDLPGCCGDLEKLCVVFQVAEAARVSWPLVAPRAEFWGGWQILFPEFCG